jgi:hypothetical protein
MRNKNKPLIIKLLILTAMLCFTVSARAADPAELVKLRDSFETEKVRVTSESERRQLINNYIQQLTNLATDLRIYKNDREGTNAVRHEIRKARRELDSAPSISEKGPARAEPLARKSAARPEPEPAPVVAEPEPEPTFQPKAAAKIPESKPETKPMMKLPEPEPESTPAAKMLGSTPIPTPEPKAEPKPKSLAAKPEAKPKTKPKTTAEKPAPTPAAKLNPVPVAKGPVPLPTPLPAPKLEAKAEAKPVAQKPVPEPEPPPKPAAKKPAPPGEHIPRTQVSSEKGLAGKAGVNEKNVYTFELPSLGETTTLAFWATGRNSLDSYGKVWLITPEGNRVIIGIWKESYFEKPSTEVYSYYNLKPITENITRKVSGPGTYKVEFEWTNGKDPLFIYRVEITS